ncbi:hypothetical protein [Streptomyces sp. UNOB3_S3]|uniref:hypothetical protein n=1 Tax=Streptomyces sp. UNOB3_S3 TaxID=2871682 RepID=UPI001E4BA94A|nr:hypothetical protein [Streptomyces sp. UNOB3_S3]MCC3775019.1 hypothetical protein [Streptomyces sp. UNOB3_S3]
MKRSRVRAATLTAAAVSITLIGTQAAASAENCDSTQISGTVTVEYHCVEPPYPEADSTMKVTFSAPPFAVKGSDIKVNATVQSTTGVPLDIPANGVNGKVGVVYGGAFSGSTDATGLTTANRIPKGQPLTLTGGTTKVKATAAGVVTFTPGKLETLNWLGNHLVCTPKTTPAVAVRTLVAG